MADSSAELEARLERIETALAHLQHALDGITESLNVHYRRMSEFETRFQRLEHEIQELQEDPDSPDPADEKPPHY